MQKIREMIDANTVVGEPITTPDGMMLIPVSKVVLGFVGGGTDYTQKQDKSGFGGGTGAGVTVVPVAFLAVKGENVEMIYVAPPTPPSTTFDRIIDAVPDVIDKIGDFINKDKDFD